MGPENELPVKQTDVLLFLLGENPAEARRREEIERFMEMIKNQPNPFQPQPYYNPFQPPPLEIENIENSRKRQMEYERQRFNAENQWRLQQLDPAPPSGGLQNLERSKFSFWRNKK
jgi:hypothetical protein